MKLGIDKIAAAVLVVAAAGAANADSSAVMNVTANIASGCVVGSAGTMNFGGLSMLDAATGRLSTAGNAATASFDAACTKDTPTPTLRFVSENAGQDAAFRLKHSSGRTIDYTLYQGESVDVQKQITPNSAAAFGGLIADGDVHTLSVTGHIAPADKNNAPVGAYSDKITITVEFAEAS